MTRARVDGGNWGGDPHIAGHGHGTGTPTYRPLYSHADIDRLLQDLTADDSETPAASGGKRFATVVVGSYEGELDGFYTADDVDYLCTGSGDQTTIQQAIDAIFNSGVEGAVLLLDGDYLMSGSVTLKDGVSLYAPGPMTVLRTSSATAVTVVSASSYTQSIRNLRLESTAASGQRVLELVGVHNFEVSNCAIIGGGSSSGYPVWIESCSLIRFIGNYVQGGSTGVEVAGVNTNEVGVFANNIINDCYRTGIAVAVDGATVTGNLIQGLTASPAAGVYVSGDDVTVTGNRMEGGGIDLSGSSFSTVTGNTVRNGTINVKSAAASCVVVGNVVRDADGHGIHVNGSLNNVVSDNLVTNWGTSAASATYDGIYLQSADNNSVQGNRVHTGSVGARYAINVGDTNCDNNLVTNNDLLNGGGLNNAGIGTVTAAGNRV